MEGGSSTRTNQSAKALTKLNTRPAEHYSPIKPVRSSLVTQPITKPQHIRHPIMKYTMRAG